MLVGDVQEKTVLDLGCGNGFFTNAFAEAGASKTIGIDNSSEQIRFANRASADNAEFHLGDIFSDEFPHSDIVIAPYVIGYASDTEMLLRLFSKIYASLSDGGRMIAVVDLPEGNDLRRFGAMKSLLGERADGTRLEIRLYDGHHVCTLNAIYFAPETIEHLLHSVGLTNVHCTGRSYQMRGSKYSALRIGRVT